VSAALASHARAQATKTEVLGIRITKKGYKGQQTMRPFNWFPGTSVAVLVSGDEAGMITLDRDKSKITKFVDDRGNDMMKEKPRFGGFIEMSPDISSDARACLLEVQSRQWPAEGSKAILIEGTLVFVFAEGKETRKAADVAARKGAKFKLGDIPVEVTRSGKPRWGNKPMDITLKLTKGHDKIAGIKFLGADGKEIKSNRYMRSTSGSVSQWTYSLDKKVQKVTVVAELWKGLKTVEHPLKLRVGVGL
jgi:hypothetical protein